MNFICFYFIYSTDKKKKNGRQVERNRNKQKGRLIICESEVKKLKKMVEHNTTVYLFRITSFSH